MPTARPGSHRIIDERIGSGAFAAIVRASLDAIIVADLDGRVREFNPAAERMFGWGRDEALGQIIGTLIVPPDLRQRHEAGMQRMRDGAPPRLTEREVQMRAMRRDGSEFPCTLSVARLAPPDGDLFAASIRDLSELEAERRSRGDIEAFLRAISDDQTEAIFRYDADRRIVFYNLAACRLYGVTATEMLGRDILQDVDPGSRERLRDEIAALTAASPVIEATDPKLMPDGRLRWIEWKNRAIFDEAGTLTGYQSVGRDVTERHLAQTALAASEARFAAFMQHAPVGMYIKDAEGSYAIVNPEMERVFGLPASRVVGRHARDLMPADLVTLIDAADAEVRASGRPSTTEERIDGAEDYEWTLVVRFPIQTPDGGATQIGGFDIDISAIKRAQAEVERAREALHQNEKLRALGHFAAGVAHELNNPLAIIAGQAELLAEDVGAGPLAARAGMIRRAADRCSGIVRNALALIRRRPAERQLADLNAILREAVEIAVHAPGGTAPAVEVRLAEGPVPLSCDPDQIHQVMLNLLTNARESFGPGKSAGRILVETRRAEDGDSVTIDVADTGPGVPEPLRARIFDAYFTTKSVGTGIGLAFCRTVVEDHGGRIDLVASAEGARFRVVLPVAPDAAPGDKPAAARAAAGHVLVVDDDADHAEATAERLRRAGHATTVALGGEAAIALLQTQSFDLALLAVGMAPPDGLAVHAWMRAARPDMAARSVFVSGSLLDADTAEALRRTRRPVLDKPLRAADLRRLEAIAR